MFLHATFHQAPLHDLRNLDQHIFVFPISIVFCLVFFIANIYSQISGCDLLAFGQASRRCFGSRSFRLLVPLFFSYEKCCFLGQRNESWRCLRREKVLFPVSCRMKVTIHFCWGGVSICFSSFRIFFRAIYPPIFMSFLFYAIASLCRGGIFKCFFFSLFFAIYSFSELVVCPNTFESF